MVSIPVEDYLSTQIVLICSALLLDKPAWMNQIVQDTVTTNYENSLIRQLLRAIFG